MSLASAPSSTWEMLTAVGTLALAFVTAVSTRIAVWLPRIEARHRRREAKATEQRKCDVADMQLKSWVERSESGRVVHVGWPWWYPIKPVLGKLVSVRGAYEATSFGAESENQVRMAFEPDEPRDDMWFLLFYDPEGNRRILLSTFPRDGIFGTFVSQVYPAPYDEDPTFLAMEKCPEIEKGFADDIARSSQDSPANE
jgi:hypothetical protein